MIGAEVRGVAASLGRMSHSGAVDYVALAMASRRVRDLSGRLASLAASAGEPPDHAVGLRGVHDILEALIDSNRATPATLSLVRHMLEGCALAIGEWEATTGPRPARVLPFPDRSLAPHSGPRLVPDPDPGPAPDLDPGAA